MQAALATEARYSATDIHRMTGAPASSVRRVLADLHPGEAPNAEGHVATFLDAVLFRVGQEIRRAGYRGRIWNVLLEFGRRRDDLYASVSQRLLVNHEQVYLDEVDRVTQLDAHGQLGIREVILKMTVPVVFEDGHPVAMDLADYPKLIVDPRRGWGAPTLRGTRVRTDDVVRMWRAEGGVEQVCRWYDLDREAVEQALRYERVL